ncbi:MAG TPA: DedA family protein [Kofleriaceae bacterium]|nr:DedA family protein [Kofleriaceae bacterium]
MDSLFGDASLPLITLLLVLGGFGLPIPEDPALIAAGALAAKGVAPIWLSVLCCVVGVIGGDLMLFLGARHLGPAVKRSRPFRAIGAERLKKVDDLLMRRGWLMVFLARHMMGIRAVTFALAGMHHMKVRTFLIADCLAFAITGPMWWGGGYYFATRLEELSGFKRIEHIVVISAIVLTVGYFVYAMLRNRKRAQTAPAAIESAPPESKAS